MLAVEIPFLVSVKKDGKDVHAHRVRLFSFLPLNSPVLLGVSGTELLTETKQVYSVHVPKYLNHSGWEVGKDDDDQGMNEELVMIFFVPSLCQNKTSSLSTEIQIFGNVQRKKKISPYRNTNFNNENYVGREAIVYIPSFSV